MQRRIILAAVMLFCVLALWAAAGNRMVYADEAAPADVFSGTVELLKQENSYYVMQVTVENKGEDFTGTVQLVFVSAGSYNCAYSTDIVLPSHGKKQFTVNVMEQAAETLRGVCRLNFLDEKGNALQSIQLNNVFGNAIPGISVGILSDNYSGLTFMDAGGEDFSLKGTNSPLELVELNADNLQGYLDGLYFLIIDQFNVFSLSEEKIQAIQDWVRGGGWLLIGTGAYAEQTLSGFDPDFFEADILGISEPGEDNTAQMNIDRSGYYYSYTAAGVDFRKISIAELDVRTANGFVYESEQNPGFCMSAGGGMVMIFNISLGEGELQKLDTYAVRGMYEEPMYQSNSYQSFNGSSDLAYAVRDALAFIDSSNTNLDLSLLEILIGVYVVLIGPVLYLVLRRGKKSEWYWIGVPALGLLFIAGVYLFGQGVRVNDTRVYSVTAQQADSNREMTYFLAYHSGVKPWDMILEDCYEAAGPGWIGYYGGYNSPASEYFYTVRESQEGLRIGIKPHENFESGYLYAEGKAEGRGTIRGTGLKEVAVSGAIDGTVANDTDRDLAYLAVWNGSYIMAFSDVKAGESLDLQQAARDGRCVYEGMVPYYDNLMSEMTNRYWYRSKRDYEEDDIAALIIGLGIADQAKPADESSVVLAGVIRDYRKTVADRCNETSYGCLYSYAEMEVAPDASN